jgi:hypothetical protein
MRLTRCYCLLAIALACFNFTSSAWAQQTLSTDLLIVGGNEAGVAAAVQAARSGVKNVVLVNDIDWLGGQFSAEAVGAIDEWTIVNGKRTNFPRSGLFLEIINQIYDHNQAKYGMGNPGNAWTASDTIEPADAHMLFARLLKTATRETGATIAQHVRLRPIAVKINAEQATVDFAKTDDPSDAKALTVVAKLVIDCSDWGDVMRLSGAEYFAGADPRSRFDEPSAPENPTESDRNEMNPISYCIVARETNHFVPIVKPPHYDERRYYGATNATREAFDKLGWPKKVLYLNVAPFVDNDYPLGIYSQQQSVYTQRRLVDAHHNGLTTKLDVLLFNWVVQDYPLYHFPSWVAEALEKTEPGASRKNIVEMTHAQRQIVFEDAKHQSLCMLYFLKNLPEGAGAERFKKIALVDDFGTPDMLPPKPYIREGARLHALSMLREQDIRTPHNEPRWAKVMPHDALFGFQFNIDFHPTRRQFLNDDPSGPWALIHTPTRNWSTHTDRAMLSARSLVPVKVDRLIGSSKNIGLTSITSAALRLHGQMMLAGQASGALAAMSLAQQKQPREIVASPALVEQLQRQLAIGGKNQPGVLLWPYHDIQPQDNHFVAATLLTAWQIMSPLADSVYFKPEQKVTRREALQTAQRAIASLDGEWVRLQSWPGSGDLDKVALEAELRAAFKQSKLDVDLIDDGELTRATLARMVWQAVGKLPRWQPSQPQYLQPGHDADQDGIEDRRDPLPFDKDNDNIPDRIDRDTPRS